MLGVERSQPKHMRVILLGLVLALAVSIVYLLVEFRVLGTGDLQNIEESASIIYAAAGSYFIGGLLILARRRWLWIVGAGINALVILFFFQAYQDRPSVILSPAGLVSKFIQIALELNLLYLIFEDWRASREKPA